MPFCMTSYFVKSISRIASKLVTLQVRISLNRRRGKKAFLSVSGGLTLEAALVLTLFIFASVTLMLPMKILNTQRKIQAALECVGEDFSKYTYLQEQLDTGLEALVSGAGDFAKEFCHYLGAGIAESYIEAQVMEHADTSMIQQVTMKRSEFLTDGAWFDLILDYEIQMPFSVLGLHAVSCTARCRRRAWIGLAGKNEIGEIGASGEQMVYVGKHATRYHLDRYCHYLANNLTAVSFDEVDKLRNQSGGKYSACAVCASLSGSGSTVYIMLEGKSYHASRVCRAIISYVRMVPLSEVEHLGACSYCGK